MSTILQTQVLALNKYYMPHAVISLKRALKALVKGRANIVDIENGIFIDYDIETWAELSQIKEEFEKSHKINGIFIAPKVIRFVNYDKAYINHPKLTRRNLLARDDFIDQYTGEKLRSDDFTIDHVVPKSKGGKTTWSNCVVCSHKINVRKGDKSLEESGLKLIRKPIKPLFVPNLRKLVESNDMWKSFISRQYWDTELQE